MTLHLFHLKLEDKYLNTCLKAKTKLLQQILLHKFLVDNSNNINNDRIDMSTATVSVYYDTQYRESRQYYDGIL